MIDIIKKVTTGVKLYHVHRQLVLLQGELGYLQKRFNALGNSPRDESEKQFIHRKIPLLKFQIEDYEDSFAKLKGREFW
jgi:hypothetical protein